MMLPAPCKCPNCGEPARCIDWVEAEGIAAFDHQYECDDCGVFAFSGELTCLAPMSRVVVWRDGTPPKLEALAQRRQALVNVADAKMQLALEALHAD